MKTGTATVSIVGYTNAGKSTLMNHFINPKNPEKHVLAKDQLFATLDTKSRRIERPNIPPFVLSDTVGFISRMPDHLKQSFIATLEEITSSELIVVVLDGSSPYLDDHVQATDDILASLDVDDIPKLYVLNKIDIMDDAEDFIFYKHPYVKTSLATGAGLTHLETTMIQMLFESSIEKTYLIPYRDDHVKYNIKNKAWIHSETLTDDGTLLTVKMPFSYLKTVKNYEI